MNRIGYALLFAAFFPSSALADGRDEDIDAIKHVVQTAYVDGILNLGEVGDIKKGFHPDFGLLYVRENHLGKLTRDRWIQRIEKAKQKNSLSSKKRASIQFLFVDATGDIGMTKLEIYRGTKLVYTDYLMLLKFAEGWRIVTKISHDHGK